jgi:hypothetical protein
VEGDPLFVDPAGRDYHLLETSPAVDAGSAAQAPDFDFDYVARPYGPAHDIGAFEWNVPLDDEAEAVEEAPEPADDASADVLTDVPDGGGGSGCGCAIVS